MLKLNLTALAVVAAVSSVGVASAGTPGAAVTTDLTNLPMTTSIASDQLAFPVFARARTAADVVPANVAAQSGNPAFGGKNLALSRAVSTADGQGWVVPGNGTICLIGPDTATTPTTYPVACTPTTVAALRGLLLVLDNPATGRAVATVVAPSGTSVAARTDAGNVALKVDASGVASTVTKTSAVLSVDTPGEASTLGLSSGPVN